MEPDPYSSLHRLLIISNLQEFITASWQDLLFLCILAFLSAIFSAYETSFFSLQKSEIENIEENPSGVNRIILKHYHKSHEFLAFILVGINFVNIGIVLFSHNILQNLGEWQQLSPLTLTLLDIGGITAFLLIFAEISPKVFASQNKFLFLNYFTYFIELFYNVFYPVSYLLSRLSILIGTNEEDVHEQEASMEELKHAIDLTADQYSPKEEKHILKGLVNLRNIQANMIMTARVEMKCIKHSDDAGTVLRKIHEYGYSRLPVYEQNLDHIRGMLYVKDVLPLIQEGRLGEWHTKIREAYFIPEYMRINKLLSEFQRKKLHVAIVVDEFGGTAGLVSMEDILEEIFGEISDEYDEEIVFIKPLKEQEFWVHGKMSLLDLCRYFELEENFFEEIQGETETVGGLIVEALGKIPSPRDHVQFKQFEFFVKDTSEYLVESVILKVHTNEVHVQHQNS